jgi:hypothetical protein
MLPPKRLAKLCQAWTVIRPYPTGLSGTLNERPLGLSFQAEAVSASDQLKQGRRATDGGLRENWARSISRIHFAPARSAFFRQNVGRAWKNRNSN